MRDLMRVAVERAHRAITDGCQLIECPTQQHELALTVIANLIVSSSEMLVGKPEETLADRVVLTMRNVAEALSRLGK